MQNIESSPQKRELGPRPKRVFVEIGTEVNSIPSAGEREFGEDEIYIGIDLDPVLARRADEIASVRERKGSNIHHLSADTLRLPLKEESASEVFFGNIFGDPRISPDAKARFLEEAKRGMKESGKLIIKETSVPLPLDALRPLLNEHDLIIERIVTRESSQWPNEIINFESEDAQSINRAPDSYIIFAIKQRQSQ